MSAEEKSAGKKLKQPPKQQQAEAVDFDFDQPGFDAPLITGAVEGGDIPFVEGIPKPLYDDILLERAR
jgi:hypothetical protein